jgi:hypothetical protein
MSLADFAVKLELDTAGDGTWSQDETPRLYSFEITRGRTDALGRMVPGRLIAVMNNRDGRWASESGVVSGLEDYVPVRLFVEWTEPATTNVDDTPSMDKTAAFIVTGGASIALITTDSWTGSSCIKVTFASSPSNVFKRNFDLSDYLLVNASTAYTWKLRIKNEESTSKQIKIVLRWRTAAGALISTDEKTITLSGASDWEGFFITATSPGTAARLELQFVDVSGGFPYSFDIDASMVYAGSDLRPYVDGRQPGCSWAGTADASQSSRVANPSFLLFEGFLLDVSGADDKKNQTATITCGDFLEILKDRELNLGAMAFKSADVLLDRIIDRLEGELISNYGNEDATILTTNNYRNWTAVAPGGGGSLEVGVWAHTDVMKDDFEETFEGDWWAGYNMAGVGSQEGLKYTFTGDVIVAGKYRFSARMRMKPGDADTTFRVEIVRDGSVVLATTNILITQAWKKVEFTNVDLTTLGTTREWFFRTPPGSPVARTIRIDSLHCVLETAVIQRDLRAGQATNLQPIAAYNEPAGPFFDDIVDSEPGQLFVKAKDTVTGGEITFHDDDWRQSVEVVPRAVLADGDGLMQFAPGLMWRHDARDRINRVIVTSRGTHKEGAEVSSLWQLAPVRDVVDGEDFRALYSQFAMAVVFLTKVGTFNKEMVNFAVGCDMEPTATTSVSYLALRGTSIDPPSEASQVEDEDATLSFIRPLTVAMPLQESNTAEMAAIATRLLTKYKVAVARYTVPLNAQGGDNGDEDLIYATQFALDLDERILVRATFQSHSPQPSGNKGVECFIEGIRHSQARKQLIHTALILEAK